MLRPRRRSTAPAPMPARDALPSPVTFFLTAGERRRALGALRRLDADRARALCKALRIGMDDDDERRRS